MDLLSNLAIRLSKECNPESDILDKGFSVSAAGFGIGINGSEKSTDYVGIIDKNFKTLIKKKKENAELPDKRLKHTTY